MSVTDPLGRATRRVFDDCGNVESLLLPDGAAARANSAGQKSPDYGVEFDHYGRPTRWSGPAGEEGIVTYDLAGNPVEFLDADGGLTLFRRDLAGRVIERISPEGVSVRYTYDACGRIQGVHDAAGTTTFEYDVEPSWELRIMTTMSRSDVGCYRQSVRWHVARCR